MGRLACWDWGAAVTEFSDFIRNASEAERREVYMGVIDRACERQIASIPPNAMRAGPGTDAVVWGVCPGEGVEI